MKKMTVAILMILASSVAQATTPKQGGLLDGSKFCRTVKSEGHFGQPKGQRQHCLTFRAGTATDNANTFFGNPPEHFAYEVYGNELINLEDGKATGYVLVGDSLVIAETGAVLKRVQP